MRYLLLMVLATVLVCGGCSDDIECNLGEYSGDFTINSKSDVAALAGYTSISRNLTIECPSCTDLNKLICLASVNGVLQIGNNSEGNDALNNLDGLSSVTSVGGLRILRNSVLTDLDGLNGLTSVGGFYLSTNAALTNLDGLSNITGSVDGLNISFNPSLTNLDGLSGLTSVGELDIGYNGALTNLDGLSNITGSVGGDLAITGNATLPDCEVCGLLGQLTSGPTSMDVHDNLADTCTPVPANCP